MNKIKIVDTRGWDKSDPFTLPIIGMLDTLERKGVITQDIPNRMKTVGKRSLALGAHLDYLNFILIPWFNKSVANIRNMIKKDPSKVKYEDLLELSYLIESLFKTFSTINELLEKFIYEILRYTKLIPDKEFTSLDRKTRLSIKKRIRKNLGEAQTKGGLKASPWYKFVSKYRNYFTHDTALFPEYIENQDVFFSIETINKKGIVSLSELVDHFKEFKNIRETTRQELANTQFWESKLLAAKKSRLSQLLDSLMKFLTNIFGKL